MAAPNLTPGKGGTPLVAPGKISDDEQEKRRISALESSTRALLKRQRENDLKDFIKVIDDLEPPDRSAVPERYRDPAEHRGALVTRSPTDPLYRRFSEAEREWRSPDSDHWVAEWMRGKYEKDIARMLVAQDKLTEIYGRATLDEGVADASGGFATGTGATLIPRPLAAVVMIARDRVSKMRRFAGFLAMTAQEHNVPTAGAMTAAMVGESTTAAEGNPTVSQVALVAKKAQVKAVTTSELLDDAAINLVTIISQRGGGALGVLEDNQWFRLGSGTGNNVTKISGTAFTETTSGALAYQLDLLRMYYAVAQEYRQSAVFFAAANVLQMFAGARDTTNRPFFVSLLERPAPVGDDPTAEGTILRRPIFEVPFSNGELWFGDPSAAYMIGQRMGITMEVSDQVRFETDEIVWKITERIAGNNIDTVAAQYATGITSFVTSL